MILAAYLQRLDPYAVGPYFGFLGVRWYGLSYVAGFCVAWLLIRAMGQRRITPLKPQRAGDFILAIAIGTVVGGRLGYCLFYRPDLFITFMDNPPFWGVLAINEGGMASHGGMIGIVMGCAYFAWKEKLPLLHLMDLTALTGTIGVFFGRVANFVNGELFGRACDANLPWAVKFPQEIVDWADPANSKHQVLASDAYRQIEMTVGSTDPHAIIDASRHSDTVAQMLRPLLTPRHPSQIYEALMEGLLMFVILAIVWYKPRKPGVVSGWFIVSYAIVRILGEHFRTPDAFIGFEALGLTRGQWLSMLMLVIGLTLLVIWSRRNAARLGGWGVEHPAES
ncbi:MAG: prolipoprotein diacylglyceryl transferase [Planctomycetes bacterium]|nr:prolipoprotein diacylglyceryl transferase [Planctomycetota bacterium]